MTPEQKKEFHLVAGILALCNVAHDSGLPTERVFLGLGKALGISIARAIEPDAHAEIAEAIATYVREQIASFAAFSDRERGPGQ